MFARDEFWILNPLSILIGARLERDWNKNTLATKGGHTDNFAAGEVALNYRPVENAKVFLRWCEFYRNPFTDEYRWRDGVQSETTKPETGWDIECGRLGDKRRERLVSRRRTELHVHHPLRILNGSRHARDIRIIDRPRIELHRAHRP